MFLITTVITCLIYSVSSYANQNSYNFDLIARENAYNLFDDIDEDSNQVDSNSKKSSVNIKWADETNSKSKKENITVYFGEDSDNAKQHKTTKEKYAYVDWFSSSHKPEIISKRSTKTKFRKNDPYYGKHLCDNSEFTCIKVKRNDSWKSLFPNKYHRELVQRINRTNRGLWNRSWILVPNDVNRDYMDFAPLPYYRNTSNKKTIVIDLSELAFGAYDKDGELVHWGPVNPGKASTRTVRGDNFKIYRKGNSECWSKKYESKIPYCMFFHKGFALHGFAMPGYAASHGCVRTYVDDALWLNRNFADYSTRVIVKE